MTSVYRLHPSSINKNITQYVQHSLGHPPISSTHCRQRESSPWGTSWFSAEHFLNKENTLKTPPSRILRAKIFSFFNPVPICYRTFVLARLKWLHNTDDRPNYTAQKTYTETWKVEIFRNAGLTQTASGTSPNIAPYLFILQKQGTGADFVPLGLVWIPWLFF